MLFEAGFGQHRHLGGGFGTASFRNFERGMEEDGETLQAVLNIVCTTISKVKHFQVMLDDNRNLKSFNLIFLRSVLKINVAMLRLSLLISLLVACTPWLKCLICRHLWCTVLSAK